MLSCLRLLNNSPSSLPCFCVVWHLAKKMRFLCSYKLKINGHISYHVVWYRQLSAHTRNGLRLVFSCIGVALAIGGVIVCPTHDVIAHFTCTAARLFYIHPVQELFQKARFKILLARYDLMLLVQMKKKNRVCCPCTYLQAYEFSYNYGQIIVIIIIAGASMELWHIACMHARMQ